MAFVSSFLPPAVGAVSSHSSVSSRCVVARRVTARPEQVSMSLVSSVMERAREDTAKLIDFMCSATGSTTRRALATAALGFLLFVTSLAPAPSDAYAASSGGRVGGSSFRSAPSSSGPSGGGGGYGGGATYYSAPVMPVSPFFSPFSFYNPFYTPVIVGGGGAGFGLLQFAGVAAVIGLGASFLSRAMESRDEDAYDSTVSVSTVKVGLLASARDIQDRLDKLAMTADTSSPEGLKFILQETTLALVRNPEYVMYGAADSHVTTLSGAEAEFSQRTMAIRTNIKEETLSNVDTRRINLERELTGEQALNEAPAEYIVVSIVIANDGKLKLPRRMNSPQDVQTACRALTEIPSTELQALEVIWSPQAKGTTLTEAEMLLDHPDLRRL